MQQYGRHDAEEQRDAHFATRHLPPPARLPGIPVSREEASSPPARPAQPPRRIVPQVPAEQEQEEVEEEEEEAGSDDDEGDERLVPSHLFVRPVQPRDPVSQSVRRGQDEDSDSENDALALPVLQRRSQEVPPGRSLPPPPPSVMPPSHLLHRYHLSTFPSDVSEPDSDHDGQALPIRPRHIAIPPTPPTLPTSVQVPPPTPRRSVPSFPANKESFSSLPSVAISDEAGEILDEEEGGKCLYFVPNYNIY